ncbi:alpha/beta fold hydrolase [Acinetobacter sp.]|uniref:alpha/beta hydrolase n=1 Tax=Acinetobacter sp. TaxID=472 RepID=UPI0028256FB2|nr:alpha/beta fold hydrolase [Acinetobacter sp.]MDR0238528.1 alpha/beta fold hydrolase [Acinetobacter sp.]MDR2225243.1 alpha/beta fold hydrolase [Providencia sp.]
MKKTVLSLLLASSALMLNACGGGDSNNGRDSSTNSNIDVNNIQNPVVGTPVVYKETDMSAFAKDSVVMTYKMKGVKETETQATALVFTPKTAPPADGWPIVAWAHGTVGVADGCAPSKTSFGGDIKKMTDDLLKEGYVVVAPDYEGLGEPSGKELHPFLNVKSEAYSITDAVVATKNWLGRNASNKWAVLGHSQGGQAALGAAQYAARANLDYKGVVAVAPASNLKLTDSLLRMELEKLSGKIYIEGENGPEISPEYAKKSMGIMAVDGFTALIAASIKSTNPNNEAIYSQVFKKDVAPIVEKNIESECLLGVAFSMVAPMADYAMANNMNIDGYSSRIDGYTDIPIVKKFLEKDSQPLQVLVKKPIIIYQGGADTLVLPQATDTLVKQARALTTVIDYRTDPTWDHGTVYSVNVNNGKLVQDIKTMLNK